MGLAGVDLSHDAAAQQPISLVAMTQCFSGDLSHIVIGSVLLCPELEHLIIAKLDDIAAS